jgi:hypothetical protein
MPQDHADDLRQEQCQMRPQNFLGHIFHFTCHCQKRRLDNTRDPLLAANVLSVAGGAQLIVLVAHQLAVDLISWRIIAGRPRAR